VPKCKNINCKKQFEKIRSNQVVCSSSCAYHYTKQLKEKKEKKEWTARKKRISSELMTVQDHIKLTQAVFNKYIRTRDEGNPCISCDNPNMKKINASHYYNANNHWSLRFNEDNVHSSCEYCNTHLSGNLIEYRPRLIKKIGIKRFEVLEATAHSTMKYTREELIELREYYKNKTKELK